MHKYLVSNDGCRAGANADFVLRRHLAGWSWSRRPRCGFSCLSCFSSWLHIEQHVYTLQQWEVILTPQTETLIADGTVFKSQLHDCRTEVKFIAIIKQMSQENVKETDKSWQVVLVMSRHNSRPAASYKLLKCVFISARHTFCLCIFLIIDHSSNSLISRKPSHKMHNLSAILTPDNLKPSSPTSDVSRVHFCTRRLSLSSVGDHEPHKHSHISPIQNDSLHFNCM